MAPVDHSYGWMRPSFHPLYGRLLVTELRQQGFNDQEIFSGSHFCWDDLQADTPFLAYGRIAFLIDRAQQLTDKPWLGVEQNTFGEAFAHGVVGFGAMSAPTLGEALKFAQRYLMLRESVLSIELQAKPESESLAILLHEKINLGCQREFICGSMVATILRLLEAAAGQVIDHVEIELPFPAPAWQMHYHRLLNGRVNFSAPRLALVLPNSILQRSPLAADDHSYRAARRECELLLERQHKPLGLTDQVRRLLLGNLAQLPSQTQVCEQLHLSPRTLMRKLKSEGYSYRQLVDESRAELAAWHLLQSNDPIEQIALDLGYADASNFSRTFRRWYGMPPNRFRHHRAEQAENNDNRG
ncbi:AraC family transcriptional regulator [Aestuariirhabdus sp. Z084]|uniref:AraC family transcriptional regulator n=1 Tax=Aestuariirhabdus haliotis TaxID=2918751 RepID=UPI00201B35B9|nr:AraC family transcriptional regulator [Aestuariirhabdus haliotis]MCL6414914.1 AraC family transcriptional regulator [Aestuariirhabdus haliotis]MCL6418846.1 AraC family transcriptional regulator [Aestuariirhabdus haliotis]